MTITYKAVHTALWADRIIDYDRHLSDDWVCDVAALNAGRATGPSPEAVAEFLARDNTVVVVAVEGTSTVTGYLIVDDNSHDYGGCRGRWMGADSPEVIQGMFDVVCEQYGWVWGRITNPRVQDAIVSFGAERRHSEHVYTYRKP